MQEGENNSISIEAGHIYPPDVYTIPDHQTFEGNFSGEGTVDNQHVAMGLTIATKLRAALAKKGTSSEQILFVDDIAPREKQNLSEDPARWELFIQRPIQQIADKEKLQSGTDLSLYFEHTFIPQAKKAVEEIKRALADNENWRLSEDGRSIISGSGKQRERIRLLGYTDEYPELPSCEVLDLCVYREKLVHSRETVTVLPIEYRKQQERVRKLFSLLNEDTPVTIIFFNSDGTLAEVDQWHSQPSPFANQVKETTIETIA